MKRGYIISGIVVLVAVSALVIYSRLDAEKRRATLFTEVVKGDFEIAVTTAGELRAENSVDIKAPEITQRRDMRSKDLRIQDIVPEGTIVEKGDYVAQLDRSEFDNTLKEIIDRLQTAQKELEMKILDTAVTLSLIRDEIHNQKYIVESDSISLVNSKYEPPTTIRQIEISFDQSKRTLGQKERKYMLRVAQAKFEINNLRYRVLRITRSKDQYEEVLSNFIIKAPAPGMIVYKRDWRGTKRKTGSEINPFDRVVAILPDMSSMLSRIYVTEIDISKIKVGQKVDIVVDALPQKAYNGLVTSVANIGEKLPNTDSKVFEILIRINGTDPLLRPSMTTGNKIVVKTFKDVTFIPIECVQAEEDSIPFVYTKNRTKQIVLLGASDDKDVIIEQGLEPGARIYLASPEKQEKYKLAGNDLIPVIKERERARRAENEKFRKSSSDIEKEKTIFGDSSAVQDR
jgi:HlyD family secretion protein